MAEPSFTSSGTKRYAVVTGANKGIGLAICRQLASNGVMVVLTARDEKRGLEALEKLKGSGLSDHVVFHQLDVADPSTIAPLAHFIKTQFGKLDILVNNAGVSGVIIDEDKLRASGVGDGDVKSGLAHINWFEMMIQTYELTEACLQTNYYGAKRMIEGLLPLLKLSDSPRIVNVSSIAGRLRKIKNEWAKGVLNDAESLTEDKVEEVLNEFLKDFKEDSRQAKGWPAEMAAYTISKAAVNAYTRILAKKYPKIIINCVCPGPTKTEMTYNNGKLTAEEGAESPVRLALLPNGGPSGYFFDRKEISSFE